MSAAETTTRTKAKTATAVNATGAPASRSPVRVRLLGVCKIANGAPVLDTAAALRRMAARLLSTPEGRRAIITTADALLAASAPGNAKFPLGTTARSAAPTARKNPGAPSRLPVPKPNGSLL